jgi:hypothetical protein
MKMSYWVALLTLTVTAVAAAQIPVTKEPRHRVAFENADLRILDVNIPPGDTSLEHMHDRDVATVAISDGAETRLQTSGQPWGAVRPKRPMGDVSVTEYAGKPGSHRIENVGKIPYLLFAVENLRAKGWATEPSIAAPGTTLATESRAFKVYDVRLGKDRAQTSHTHAVPTILVLVGGLVMSDGPDAQAKANAPAAVGLKQLDRPGQWMLVPRGDTHHLVRLGVNDARVVEIEVR